MTPNGACFRPTQLGYPANFAVPANFNPLNAQARYIPKDNPDGYVQSWHFNMQREITPTLVVDAAYVGNHSVHLMVLGDYNQAVPNQAGQNLSLQSRRPYQNFNAIEVAEGMGFSLSRVPAQGGKAISAGLVSAEFFHLVEGDRQRFRPSGSDQRR